MIDIIIILIIALLMMCSLLYIYKARKSGQKCIGCPHACHCKTKESSKKLFK